MSHNYWGHTVPEGAIMDDMGPEDLEALELYERARQGLSRTYSEEMES